MKADQIVVTGTGAVAALGETLPEIFEALLLRKSGVRPIESFDASAFPTQFAAEVNRFDESRIGQFRELKRYDRSALFAVAAAEEALLQSECLSSSVPSNRIAVLWASGNGGIRTSDSGLLAYGKQNNPKEFSPFFQANVLIDAAAARIARHFALRGPCITTVSACASGNVALLTAMTYLRAGLCDIAVVGGSEAAVSPSVLGGFSSMKALSRNNEDFQNASVPFSASRDGFVIGEGAAALILERAKDADKRGVPARAILSAAYAMNDGYSIAEPDSDGNASAECMQQTIEQAGLSVIDMDVIYTHGTSTQLGDLAEYKALKHVFQEHLTYTACVATKANTGHLLGASAALEAVLSVEMLHRQHVIPHRGFAIDPTFPELFFPVAAVEQKIKHVLNHASGFGGQHASSLFSSVDV